MWLEKQPKSSASALNVVREAAGVFGKAPNVAREATEVFGKALSVAREATEVFGKSPSKSLHVVPCSVHASLRGTLTFGKPCMVKEATS